MIAGGDISLYADTRFQRSRQKPVARFRCNRPRSNISGAECPELPERLVIKVPPGLFGRDRPRKPCAYRVSQFLGGAALKRCVFAAQAEVIGIQRDALGRCPRGIHTPETD